MPTKKPYEKQALTLDQQIELLEERGLIITDKDTAKHYLSNISYYHFSGYCKPFQNSDNTFFETTTFDDVLNLYFFDRKLRLLFLNGLERVEKSFKAQFIYHLSIKYGPHCLTEHKIFEKHLSKISENLQKSKEPFIKNFREKYSNEHPPIWMLVEILSFGEILNIFIAFLDNEDRKTIARFFGLGSHYLFTWLENLREVRNICAHYSRLWNRKITKHLKRGDQHPELKYDNHIFDSIVITSILLKRVSPSYDWLLEIKELIHEYKINLRKMDFPKTGKKYSKKKSGMMRLAKFTPLFKSGGECPHSHRILLRCF